MIGDATDLDSLGNYIRARRQTLGLTQTQLGQRLGWMQERVSILENGKYGMPSLPALARIAIACEVPLMEILRAAGYGDDSQVEVDSSAAEHPNRTALLYTLQQLIAIDVGTMKDALNRATDLLAGVMGAEKVDAFMYDPTVESLIALGASNTELGRKQHRVGMDRLAAVNRGREVEIYQTGEPYLTGDAGSDPGMLVGMVEGLGISSFLGVPLSVDGERRGVLIATSSKPNQFHEEDISFFQTVARWVGVTAHRAELLEKVQRAAVENARRIGAEELIEYLGRDTKMHLAPVIQRLNDLSNTSKHHDPVDYAREFDFMRDRVQQIERSIDDLLDASALERGLVPLNLQSVDLVVLVRAVVAQQRGDVAQVSIRAPEQLHLQIDESRVRSAIDALVRHALHRPAGTESVAVEVGIDQYEGAEHAVVSIRDESAGSSSVGISDAVNGSEAHLTPSLFGLSVFGARSVATAHGGALTIDIPGPNLAIYTLLLPLTMRAGR